MNISLPIPLLSPNRYLLLLKKKERRSIKYFNEDELAKVVDKLPVYPGGNEGFQAFIDVVSKEMSSYLEDNREKNLRYDRIHHR